MPPPSWHSPGSRARAAAPRSRSRSRSAAPRHAAASARRRQQRLPILSQRCCPAGRRRRPGPAPLPGGPNQSAARGCEASSRGSRGPPEWALAWRTAEVGEGRLPGLSSLHVPFPSTHYHHINTGSLSRVRRVEPGWREPCRPFSFCCTSRDVPIPRIRPESAPSSPRGTWSLVSAGVSRSYLSSGSCRSQLD